MRRLLLILTFLLPGSLLRAEMLTLATEPYPPFVVVEGDKITGGGIAVIDLIMKDTGQDYRIEVMPWARALVLAQKEPMRCAFATARTPERQDLFKWVIPLLVVKSYLVAAAGSGVRATTLDEAKRYIVGTQLNDNRHRTLMRLGFPRIDPTSDINLSLRKLANHRIDLMPMTEEAMEVLTARGEKLEKVVQLTEEQLGIACNPSVPDSLIETMNANLKHLHETGTVRRLLMGDTKTSP